MSPTEIEVPSSIYEGESESLRERIGLRQRKAEGRPQGGQSSQTGQATNPPPRISRRQKFRAYHTCDGFCSTIFRIRSIQTRKKSLTKTMILVGCLLQIKAAQDETLSRAIRHSFEMVS